MSMHRSVCSMECGNARLLKVNLKYNFAVGLQINCVN
jgi:hypothetical protein